MICGNVFYMSLSPFHGGKSLKEVKDMSSEVEEILRREMEKLREEEEKEKELDKLREKAKKEKIIDAVVTEITFGKRKDFMTSEQISKLEFANAEDDCVKIVAYNEKYRIQVTSVWKRSMHRKANWRKFLKEYPDGKNVKLIYNNDTEYWNILLP